MARGVFGLVYLLRSLVGMLRGLYLNLSGKIGQTKTRSRISQTPFANY